MERERHLHLSASLITRAPNTRPARHKATFDRVWLWRWRGDRGGCPYDVLGPSHPEPARVHSNSCSTASALFPVPPTEAAARDRQEAREAGRRRLHVLLFILHGVGQCLSWTAVMMIRHPLCSLPLPVRARVDGQPNRTRARAKRQHPRQRPPQQLSDFCDFCDCPFRPRLYFSLPLVCAAQTAN